MKKINFRALLDSNKYLRIIAVVVAIFCWIGVQMTQNITRRTEITNVPVTISIPSTILSELGLSPIDAEDTYVNVTMEGPSTVVGQLKPEDLRVTASVLDISEPKTYDLGLSLSNLTELRERGVDVVSFDPPTVRVRFDRMDTKSFDIVPMVKGLSTPSEYVADQEKVTPARVTVTGPQADLDKIERVVVESELDEPLTKTYVAECPVLLLDAQGERIDVAGSPLSVDVETAQLMVRVLKYKTLPLIVHFTNKPLSFPLEELELLMNMSTDEITVAGPVDIMDNYREIVLAGSVNLKELSPSVSQFIFEVELPAQVNNVNSVTAVEISFDTDDWETAVFNTNDLRLENVPLGYNVNIITTALNNITLVGKGNILAGVTADDIVVSVDLSVKEVTHGQINYPVKVSVPGKGLVWAVGEYSVIVQAEKIEP